MGKHLEGKAAIITGSGHGIGRAIALAMAREGAKVVTNARRAAMAEAVAGEIRALGGAAVAFPCDVGSFEATRGLIEAAVDHFGRLDILVNNAGHAAPHVIWNMTEEQWDSVIASNLKGTFNCIHHAAAIMREQQSGRIVNTISGAWLGVTGNANYAAAKGGILSLTKTVAEEMAKYGVTCNCYGPIANTDDGAGTYDNAAFTAFHRKRYEAGRVSYREFKQLTNMPAPQTVPPLIVYLCSDQAARVTGQAFMVYGNEISIISIRADDRIIFKEDSPWTVEDFDRLDREGWFAQVLDLRFSVPAEAGNPGVTSTKGGALFE